MFAGFVFKLIQVVLNNVSGDLRKAVKEGIQKLEVVAKKTPNPFDDFAVSILKVIVGIDD